MVRPRNDWDDRRRLATGMARSARSFARQLEEMGDAARARDWHATADANEAGAAEYRALARSHDTRSTTRRTNHVGRSGR